MSQTIFHSSRHKNIHLNIACKGEKIRNNLNVNRLFKKLHPHNRILSKTKTNKRKTTQQNYILTLLTKNYIHNILNISLCSISFYSMKLLLWNYIRHVHHNVSHSFWMMGFQAFFYVPPFYIICILLNMVYLFLDPVTHPSTKLRQYIVLPLCFKKYFY